MRERRWAGTALDVVITAVVAGLIMVSITESTAYVPRPLDPVSVLVVVLVAIWSGLARRWPRTALVGVSVCLFVAFAWVVPAFELVLAMAVPLFGAGRAGRLGWGGVMLAIVTVSTAAYRLVGEGSGASTTQVLLDTVQDGALLAVVLLLGAVLHSRRIGREKAVLQLQLNEREHQRRLTEERLRTAHDLHDVLAHTLTLVTIQAGVATESMGKDDARSRAALEDLTSASREAMSDLRGTIAVLRADGVAGESEAPAPGLAEVPTLLEVVRAAGIEASLHTGDGLGQLRPSLGLAVYRIVQESLTNVVRHSDASAVRVQVRGTKHAVRVEVHDDGSHERESNDTGFGLRGMAERVAALGGEMTSGPVAPDVGGFAVRVQLPTGGSR